MIDVLGERDPGEQSGRGITTCHRPCRCGRDDRSKSAVELVAVLRADDHALHQLGCDDVHLEGAFFGDLFVEFGLRLYFFWDDLDRLGDGQILEGLCRQRTLFLRDNFAFVSDRLGLGRSLRSRSNFESEHALQALQFFAFARPEELALEPVDLRPQRHDFLLEQGDFVVGRRFIHGAHG